MSMESGPVIEEAKPQPQEGPGIPGEAKPTAFEYSLLRTPYEGLVRSFRLAQKQVEKESAQIVNYIAAGKIAGDPQECASRIDKLVAKLRGLKQVVEAAERKESEYLERCQKRLRLLADCIVPDDDTIMEKRVDFNAESSRIDRILAEYLAREGFVGTAEEVVSSSGIEDQVDLDVFREAHGIVEAFRNHDVGPALEWCNENRSKLKKLASPFETHLHMQCFVEFILHGKSLEAVQYVREHVQAADFALCPELQCIMALPVFAKLVPLKEGKRCLSEEEARLASIPPKYAAFVSEGRWQHLADLFRKNFCDVYGLPQKPLLEVLLLAGFFALKSPVCEERKSVSCPTCDPDWQPYLKLVPKVHRVRSVLICPISGDVMDDDNPPMSSPEGHVYSQRVLQRLVEESEDGLVVCPQTKKKFPLEAFQKIYVTA